MNDKTYDPSTLEPKLAKFWLDIGYGKPSGKAEPYSIMVPPPNVTGTLHLGHGLQYAIMDTLVRQKRAQGYNVLLQAGTDHAGIATQMVVERQLAEKGIKRSDMDRESFIEKVWEWKGQSGQNISEQMKKMGISVDWDTECFTLDPHFSKAVQKTFIKLHEQGFIYRGKRLVNWDTVLKTAISDLEVKSETRQGQIWYVKYPMGNTHIIVATTRPETMLGDTAVCVHPDDERYQHLIGSSIQLPLTNREIPIIADDSIDPEFGSGCVKITPAHDFTDYEIGNRHNLPMINIMNEDGTLNESCPDAYQNLDRFVARKKIVQDLKELGLIEKIEPHTAAIPFGDRSHTVLEPLLTDQWYVKMDQLAQKALEAHHSGDLTFVPNNWGKTFDGWLTEIEDWCVSRQLWWGHRIPAYYDSEGNIYVGEDEASVREKHKISGELTQDNDVLDTWFSSALWPFATQGWPDNTDRYETFYPNSLLVTGFDIIFFWVARMVMMGTQLTEQVPFPKVYVTGLIRDENGQKMSKSRGNVLDPIDLIKGATLEQLIEKRTKGMMQPAMKEAAIKATKKSFPNGMDPYGTDALRFTFLQILTQAKDINFDLNKLRTSRNFCNKIWNAARFLSQHDEASPHTPEVIKEAFQHQIHEFIANTQKHLDNYRFDLYAQCIYEFFWHEFCDWHLELAKVSTDAHQQESRMAFLYQAFDTILTILHPSMPFITEALWQDKYGDSKTITSEEMPSSSTWPKNEQSFETYKALQTFIKGIRNIRSELNISPKTALTLYCIEDKYNLTNIFSSEIQKLAGISNIIEKDEAPQQSCVFISKGIKISIDLAGKIDPKSEISRLDKRISKLDTEYSKVINKTQNPNYQKKAPQDLKDKDQKLLSQLESNLAQLKSYLDVLKSLT